MKSRFFTLPALIFLLLAWGFYPLFAQQASQQAPGTVQSVPLPGSFTSPPQGAQAPTPYIGATPYGLTPQTGFTMQGGHFTQGATAAQQFLPGTQLPVTPVQMYPKYCGPVPLFQAPPSPPHLASPARPEGVPVKDLWPGSPGAAGLEQLMGLQPALSQTGTVQGLPQEPTSAQGSSSNPPAQLPGQGVRPGTFFTEPLSTVEAAFQQAPNFAGEFSEELRQFGYSLFATPVSTFAPVEDIPVGSDYVLGPGDNMVINVWGITETAVVRTIDRNGQIILPSVGPLEVWGLTFSQAGRLIREELSRYYRGIGTSITMGRLRTMRVYVVGRVCQPGSFTLSSLSTVTNALFASGGPLKLGSLRNIELKRNQDTVGTLDLYDFLLRGDKTRDFRLESGDTIFIPPIGPVAGITGEVNQPAIYELKGTTRVSDLIEMAGGLTPGSNLKRVQVIRRIPNAERQVIDLDLTDLITRKYPPMDIEIKNGDLVRVYPADPRIYNTVRLNGAVKQPGEYELKPGMRLSQILHHGVVLPEAHLEQVDIARIKDDLSIDVVRVSLREAWAGDRSQDVTLQPRDLITVRSEYRKPWTVTLTGEVKRPGTYTIRPGERLSSVLKTAGGFTDKSYLKGVIFTRRSVFEIEKNGLDEFVRSHEQRLLAEAGQLTAVAFGLSREEAAAQQSVLSQRMQALRVLASKITLGRVVVHLDDLDKLEGSPDDILLEDGDTLTIPQKPATIVVMGSVRNPTAVLYKEGLEVQYYLNRAGDLTPDADPKGLYLIKADGSAVTGFMRLRNVEPGDVIIAPPSTEAKFRWGPVIKDIATVTAIIGQAGLGLAALATIF